MVVKKFLDLAVMLRNKHLESIELEKENERLSQLVEKLANESDRFQEQVGMCNVHWNALSVRLD